MKYYSWWPPPYLTLPTDALASSVTEEFMLLQNIKQSNSLPITQITKNIKTTKNPQKKH